LDVLCYGNKRLGILELKSREFYCKVPQVYGGDEPRRNFLGSIVKFQMAQIISDKHRGKIFRAFARFSCPVHYSLHPGIVKKYHFQWELLKTILGFWLTRPHAPTWGFGPKRRGDY